MPPKKKPVTDSVRARKHKRIAPTVTLDCHYGLFASVTEDQENKYTKEEKKKKNFRTAKNRENAISDFQESVSETVNECSAIAKIKEKIELDDDFSLEIYQGDKRVRIVDGKIVPHEIQPKVKPVVIENEDSIGPFPPPFPARKTNIINTEKTRNGKKIKQIVPKSAVERFRDTLILEKTLLKKPDIECNTSFVVFPRSMMIAPTAKKMIPKSRKGETTKPIFNYTPIRGNGVSKSNNILSTFSSTSFVFAPQLEFSSTPMEKTFNKRNISMNIGTDVCNIFDNMISPVRNHVFETSIDSKDERESGCKDEETMKIQKSIVMESDEKREEIVDPKERSISHPDKQNIPTDSFSVQSTSRENIDSETKIVNNEAEMETVHQDNEIGIKSAIPRPADCSLSEIIVDDEKNEYGRKRSRVTISENLEDKENRVEKRVIQPQVHQRIRENRQSTVSNNSSRRESLNSIMEQVSLDEFLELGENMTLKSCISENMSIGEADDVSRAQTAMTVYVDDPSQLPFYLAEVNISMENEMSEMLQLLHVVQQKEAVEWSYLPKSTFFPKHVRKLGEGAYGEVFATNYEKNAVAIKIVPFEPDPKLPIYDGLFNGSPMPSAFMLLPEVVVMKELSGLSDMQCTNSSPNFISLIKALVVKGCYPKELINAWDRFEAAKGSENDRPDTYSSDLQSYMLFITENGGIDLESYKSPGEKQVMSVIIQLLLSLTIAERELEFEHRDLHMGNVLISQTKQQFLEYKVKDTKLTVHSHGVKVNIIDFTLSRVKKGATTVYQDLENDPELFEGQGHPQFEVYRRMRKNCGGNWKEFHPRTNVWWVQYLATQMIQPSNCKPRAISAKRRQELGILFERLGEFDSCGDTFIDEKFFKDFYQGYFG